MSELQNPLFDEEKEFLERKKMEYERALRGDVEHIKDQSVMVGKIAAVGAGLVGGIWLITKAFSGKKRKKRYVADEDDHFDHDGHDYGPDQAGHDDDEDDADSEFGAGYYTAGNGQRYKSRFYRKSAADSAQAFVQHEEHSREADDLGFGATAARPAAPHPGNAHADTDHHSSFHDAEEFGDDPFQDLPYDDSRRLPTSHTFDGDERASTGRQQGTSIIGEALTAFLASSTGKVLVAQVAAVALALVTKKVSEFFPPAKNSDLATSSGYAPAETGFAPVASSVSLESPDASTHSQSL